MPSISVPIAAVLVDAGVGAATAGIIGSVATTALTGAAIGGTTAALTGGKVLKGAGLGALAGATYAGAGAAFPETMGSITGALGLGGSGTGGAGALTDQGPGSYDAWQVANQIPGGGLSGASPDQISSQIPGTLGQMGQSAQSVPGNPVASNAASGLGGLSKTDLLLGALGALGSSTKPAAPNYGAMPGPGSTAATRGPLWNQPLGTNYINRTQTNQPMTQQDWYSYGQVGGHMPAFSGNQLSFPQQMAHGGTIDAMGGEDEGEFDSDDADRSVYGEGDGLSDSVPARLSRGEYVMTASDVSRLGGGDNAAGAKRLDEMRSKIARDAGAKKHQGKVKHPLKYLKEAS